MLLISTLLYCTSYAACTSIVSGATSNNNNNNTLIYIAPACRMTSEALADSK